MYRILVTFVLDSSLCMIHSLGSGFGSINSDQLHNEPRWRCKKIEPSMGSTTVILRDSGDDSNDAVGGLPHRARHPPLARSIHI